MSSFDPMIKAAVGCTDITRVQAEQVGLKPPPFPYDDYVTPPVPMNKQWVATISDNLKQLDEFIMELENIDHDFEYPDEDENGEKITNTIAPSEFIDNYTSVFPLFLQLCLRPLVDFEEAGLESEQDQQAYVYSIAASGFMDIFTGKVCPKLFSYMLQLESKEAYTQALLQLGQTLFTFMERGKIWDPMIDINGFQHNCSSLIADPVASMIAQDGFIEKMGVTIDFYLGATRLFFVQAIGGTEFHFLYGFNAAWMLGLLGEEFANTQDDLKAASKLNNLWTAAARQKKQENPDPGLFRMLSKRVFMAKERRSLNVTISEVLAQANASI